MKQQILLATFLISSGLFAQNRPKNAIKINPLSAAVSTINVNYERAIDEKSTIGLIAHFTDYNNSSSGDKFSLSGFGIVPEYRYYLTDYAFKGLYTGAYGMYRQFDVTTDDGFNDAFDGSTSKGSLSTYGVGGMLGYQFLPSGKVPIDLTLGLGYAGATAKADSGSANDLEDVKGVGSGVAVRFAVKVGFAW